MPHIINTTIACQFIAMHACNSHCAPRATQACAQHATFITAISLAYIILKDALFHKGTIDMNALESIEIDDAMDWD